MPDGKGELAVARDIADQAPALGALKQRERAEARRESHALEEFVDPHCVKGSVSLEEPHSRLKVVR